MTTTAGSPLFVWVWLPDQSSPVVAGRLDQQGSIATFTYGRSYLDRPEAIPLYLPALPLRRGPQAPTSGALAGCIADAGPDAWGRRVIEYRRDLEADDLDLLGYLRQPAAERIGALDFSPSPLTPPDAARTVAPLADLEAAASRIDQGLPLAPELDLALLHGSSVGGARPKATFVDGDHHYVAKFSSTADDFPVVQAEFVAMRLARRCGLDVAHVESRRVAGRPVLLVERFDRRGPSHRLMVSALTILDLHDADGMAGRYASYVDLADEIRARFSDPAASLRELYARVAVNILVGNTDDHARNHAAFWNGVELTLTPAYDICPQLRAGNEARQAMAFGPGGERRSRLDTLVAAADAYHLDRADARELITRLDAEVRDGWDEACDGAELSEADRRRLWERQFVNPSIYYAD